jgi:signal transduction histidine kinase
VQSVATSTTSPTSSAAEYAELLSLTSHELRTPASVLGGYLRMLLKDTTSPLTERQRKMLEEAEKSSARMVALISEISDLAKIDSGATPLGGDPFDLFTALDDMAGRVQVPDDRVVTFDVRGAARGAIVTGDSARVVNAFAACSRAVIREQPADAHVVLDRRISRGGSQTSALVVIARADDLDRAAASAAAPFDEHRGGMGLALPIARRIIERHGGTIRSPQDGAAGDGSLRRAILVSLPIEVPTR